MVCISFWFKLMTLIYTGWKKHTIKKGTKVLVVSSEVIGMEHNPQKTTYMVMHRDQNEKITT